MPNITIIRKEFADAVKAALGGLSANQASYKTGISDEYIRKMATGKVPSEAILERFAKGMNADLKQLRIAAGYEQPSDPVQAVDIALRTTLPEISDFDRDRILEMVKEVSEEVDAEGE